MDSPAEKGEEEPTCDVLDDLATTLRAVAEKYRRRDLPEKAKFVDELRDIVNESWKELCA